VLCPKRACYGAGRESGHQLCSENMLKNLSRVKKPFYLIVALAAAALLFTPAQNAIHRYQMRRLLAEPLAKRLTVLHVRSKALRRVNELIVYTPPGYSSSNERYPVIYLLHGCPGQGSDWFLKGRAHETAEKTILAGEIKPVILVSFDGFGRRGPLDHSEFLNSVHGTVMAEDYVASELPDLIDSKFRTIRSPNARALVGVSSGGYGAVNIGTRHQNEFRVLASHSGYFDPKNEPYYVGKMLGPRGPLWDQNNPHKSVTKWRDDPDLHIYLDCGLSDSLLPDNRRFDEELTRNGVGHVFYVTKGSHRWSQWRRRFHESLLYCDQRFEALADK
jgi:enterochelin esterase-like enzyme